MRLWIAAFVAVFTGGGPALAQSDPCLEPFYLAYFDPALPETAECEEIVSVEIRTRHGPSRLGVIRIRSAAHGDDSAWVPFFGDMARRLGPAIDAMETPRLPRAITILLRTRTEELDFDPGPGVDRGFAHAVTHRVDPELVEGGECFVSVFKGDRVIETAELTFALAHEIFHCAQFNTWPDKLRDPASGWWREGSAEYFSHLVLPEGGEGRGGAVAVGFDRLSRNRSIVDMWYENVVLFFWLHNRGGPEAVGNFLAEMSGGGRAAQLAKLGELLPMENWASFVENWLDGRVTSVGGAAIAPVPAVTGEKVFRRTDQITMRAMPYAIPRWRLTFAEGKEYELALEDIGGAPRTRMKLEGSGDAWAEPPERVNACDEDKVYLAYSLSVGERTSARLRAETEDESEAGGGRCCLIGEWKPTPETLEGLAQFGMDVGAPAVAAAGFSMSCGYEGGDWRLTFRDDGTALLAFDNHTSRCIASGHGGSMSNTGTRNGFSEFAWEVTGEGAAWLTPIEHAVVWLNTVKVGPMVQEIPGAEDPVVESGLAFTCTEQSLTAQGIYGLSHYEAEYVRVRAGEGGEP
jgi:hypothetical protein